MREKKQRGERGREERRERGREFLRTQKMGVLVVKAGNSDIMLFILHTESSIYAVTQ